MTKSQNIHRHPTVSIRAPAITGPELGALSVLRKIIQSEPEFSYDRMLGKTYSINKTPTYEPRSSIVAMSAMTP